MQMSEDLYTQFPAKVKELYAVVAAVPRGRVVSYGVAGQLAGMHARQVGYWLHKNPDSSRVPCHRVVRSSGELAGGYAFGGPGVQRSRLEAEGVSFVGQKVRKTALIDPVRLSELLY